MTKNDKKKNIAKPGLTQQMHVNRKKNPQKSARHARALKSSRLQKSQ